MQQKSRDVAASVAPIVRRGDCDRVLRIMATSGWLPPTGGSGDNLTTSSYFKSLRRECRIRSLERQGRLRKAEKLGGFGPPALSAPISCWEREYIAGRPSVRGVVRGVRSGMSVRIVRPIPSQLPIVQPTGPIAHRDELRARSKPDAMRRASTSKLSIAILWTSAARRRQSEAGEVETASTATSPSDREDPTGNANHPDFGSHAVSPFTACLVQASLTSSHSRPQPFKPQGRFDRESPSKRHFHGVGGTQIERERDCSKKARRTGGAGDARPLCVFAVPLSAKTVYCLDPPFRGNIASVSKSTDLIAHAMGSFTCSTRLASVRWLTFADNRAVRIQSARSPHGQEEKAAQAARDSR